MDRSVLRHDQLSRVMQIPLRGSSSKRGYSLMKGEGREGAARNHWPSSINVYYDVHSEKCEEKLQPGDIPYIPESGRRSEVVGGEIR